MRKGIWRESGSYIVGGYPGPDTKELRDLTYSCLGISVIAAISGPAPDPEHVDPYCSGRMDVAKSFRKEATALQF